MDLWYIINATLSIFPKLPYFNVPGVPGKPSGRFQTSGRIAHQSRDREDYLGIYDTDAIFSCRRCHAIKAIKAMYLYLPIYYHFYFLGY